MEFVKPEHIRAGLKGERIISYRYLANHNGRESYEMVKFAGVRHPEDRDDHMVHAVGMCFSDVDGETQVHDLRVTGTIENQNGTNVLDPNARYLLGDWFARFGTFEAERLKASSFLLYDVGAGAWRTVSLYNGQLVVGDPEQ
jgi:hypothetical protein